MKPFRILDTTTARHIALDTIGKEYPTWLLWPEGRDRVSDAVATEREKSTYWQTAVIASRLIPVDTPSVCVDVGANLGAFAVPIAKMRPLCTVWAFEPGSVPFQHLCANVFLNGLPNVRPERLALAEGPGVRPLYLPDAGDLGSGTLRPYSDAPTIELVRTLELDDHEVSRAHIDLMKIHVCGGEAGVILGALKTLRQHEPPLLIEVTARYADETFAAVRDVLGYDLKELFPDHYLACPTKRLRSLYRRSRE